MANDKDFTKLIAGIVGASIAGVAVSATVKGVKSSSNKDKEITNATHKKTSDDIFEEERIKQEMDDMWKQIQMDDMWEEHRIMQHSVCGSERNNMADRNDNSFYDKDEY